MPPRKARALTLTPPYGYGEIVPLQRSHRVLLPHGATPQFCRALNALAISYAEMPAAARHYPVVFAPAGPAGGHAPVAVLGLADGQNLFVGPAGDWDPAAYMPAYARRYPFCLSKLYVDGRPRGDRVVCVARAYVDEQGIALFDPAGGATPYWTEMEQLLADFESDLDRTAAMCAALAKLDLLAPFTFTVMHDDAPGLRLEGMFRVDQKKFDALKPATLKALQRKGLLGHVYAHLQSLDNFAALYARAVARARAGVRA
jgi:SapC